MKLPAVLAVLALGGLLPPWLPASAAAQDEPGRDQAAPPSASSDERPIAQAGIGLLAGVPIGEFADHIEAAAGVSGHFAVFLGDSIISVGGEGAWTWYGDESRKVPLSLTLPDLVVTVNTDNAMASFHGRVRAQSPGGRWRPYVDGLVGFNYIYTRTSIEGSGNCDAYSCGSGLSSTNLDDVVLSVGGGAGVMFDPGAPGGIRLDMSIRVLAGGKADYLTEGAIHRLEDRAILDITRSRTDLIAIYFGIAVGR